MRDETVSKNYAETLFELGRKHDKLQEYGAALATVANLLDEDPRFRVFLETPRIEDAERKAVVRKVFGQALPRSVVNFVLVTIDKRRQRLLRSISRQYNLLLDEHLGREHVEVTLARKADEGTQRLIAERLSAVLGREAIPHFRVKPEIIGGLVVRTTDTIYDGSVRRRLEGMRRRLLRADLPSEALGRAQG
ncbi:MAG TPA: ATP synthase F1 subunit delta [Longimicrobiales bacterium]|nr:ATP synthase F1 subunit delta [Longimicrobiales bacterium]